MGYCAAVKLGVGGSLGSSMLDIQEDEEHESDDDDWDREYEPEESSSM